MGLFNTLVTETSYAMTTNFANLMRSLTDFQSAIFASVWDSLQSFEVIESSLDSDFKKVEEIVGSGDICLQYYRMRLQSAHITAADGTSRCVGNYIANADREFGNFLNFTKTWQDKAMHIPLIMLNDFAQANPISKAVDLVEKIWPNSYIEAHTALKNEFEPNGVMYYSLVKQSLDAIALPFNACLTETQHGFENYVDDLRSGLLTECLPSSAVFDDK